MINKDTLKNMSNMSMKGILEALKMDTSKIDNIIISDIDFNDAPKFTDAHIESADYDGKEMTEEQLNEINEDYDFVYEAVINQIYNI
jgi:cellulose biosynthesis protein BcsQ